MICGKDCWGRVLLVAGVILGASGCAYSLESKGVSPSPEALQYIVKGQTTMDEVTQLLGPPDEVIYSNKALDPLFERAFRYRLDLTRRTVFFIVIFGTYRSDTKSDHVMVFFDESGVVEQVGSRWDSKDARYGLPRQ